MKRQIYLLLHLHLLQQGGSWMEGTPSRAIPALLVGQHLRGCSRQSKAANQ
eukprot:gene9196-6473_t